ncbi:MAG: lanthionine synthetase LanC family protein [Cyanobacteria bacterium J06598_1]
MTPVSQLPAAVLPQVEINAGDYAISRPRARTATKIVDAEAAQLLKQFEQPITIVQAVVRYSQANEVNPEELLDGAVGLLENLMNANLLVFEDSEAADSISQSFEVGEAVNGWVIRQCIQVLEDTELYQVEMASGAIAALKIARAGQRSTARTQRLLDNEALILQTIDDEIDNESEGQIAPKLLASGTFEEQPYLLMEWCEGAHAELAAYELRAQNQVEPLLRLLSNVLKAYAQLHAKGVVHADIHPRNILVTEQGAVKIIDFGLSQIPDEEMKFSLPRGGVGYFFEPEYAQACNDKEPVPAPSFLGEQYALGALMYVLLTGQHYLDFSLELSGLFKQITTLSPIGFDRLNLDTLFSSELEQAVRKALSKDPQQRFSTVSEFVLAFDLGTDSCLENLQKRDILTGTSDEVRSHFIETVLARLQPDLALSQQNNPEASGQGPTASVNYGAAGVAYALLQIASATDRPDLLGLADIWIEKAVRLMNSPDAFYDKGLEVIPETVGTVSPYHTASGIYLVQALIANAQRDLSRQQRSIQQFAAATLAPTDKLDLTLGKTSVLLGATLLLESVHDCSEPYLDTSDLRRLGDEMFEAIALKISSYPPIAEATDFQKLGIAHGWAGLLYGLLRWCRATGQGLPSWMPIRLQQLADCGESTEYGPEHGRRWPWQQMQPDERKIYMPGWCNGSIGYVHLWVLAFETYGEPEYLEFAKAAALESQQQLGSVGNLCCGIAGQAYGLLALYQVTGEDTWLRGAEALSDQAIASSQPTLLRGQQFRSAVQALPNSLYKGDVGIAVLAAELNRPQFAAMPLFAR